MRRPHLLTALLGLLLPVSAGGQEEPSLQVRLSGATAPSVAVSMHDLLADGRFVQAMESGFPLYVEFTVELRESRALWDRRVSEVTWEYVVTFDPVRERFVLDDAQGTETIPSRDVLEDRLAQEYELQIGGEGDGPLYYAAVVEARTLEDSDVDEVYAWLQGEDVETRQTERPGPLIRAARRLLVAVASLPSIRLEAHSRMFPPQS